MDAVGLCLECRWARVSANRQGSRFFRCARSETDRRFARYPPLPVKLCPGYEKRGSGEDAVTEPGSST